MHNVWIYICGDLVHVPAHFAMYFDYICATHFFISERWSRRTERKYNNMS